MSKLRPDDLCVLYMMGWINDDGDFNEETFGADVMSLPPRCFTGQQCAPYYLLSSLAWPKPSLRSPLGLAQPR